jgi:uncharacterized protein
MKKLLLFVALVLFSPDIFSQEYSTLVVEGKAIIKEVPENILITINLVSSNPDYATCSDNLMKSSNNLQKDLIALGTDPKTIKANNFRVQEEFEYQMGNRVKKGFQGIIELTVEDRFSNQLLNTIMEIMKKPEYEFSYTVQFILSGSQKQSLINYAIENSIADAKLKAEIIAKSANIELVKIKSINYSNEFTLYDFESDKFTRVNYRPSGIAIRGASSELESKGMAINQEELAIEKLVTIEWITRSK